MRRIRKDPTEKLAELLIKRLGKKAGDMENEEGAILKQIIREELRKKAIREESPRTEADSIKSPV